MIIDLIGFGIVMPILPFWAREYGASGTTLGWLAATYAAAQFVFAPLWGSLSDRVGRRPVLLGTIAGTTLSLALLAVATSIPMLFAARLLAGVFAANFSVASAYVSDVTPPEQRTGRMALLGACFAIGFTLGPALAGPLSLIGIHAPIVVAASLSAANLVFAWLRLAEPREARAVPRRRRAARGRARPALRRALRPARARDRAREPRVLARGHAARDDVPVLHGRSLRVERVPRVDGARRDGDRDGRRAGRDAPPRAARRRGAAGDRGRRRR